MWATSKKYEREGKPKERVKSHEGENRNGRARRDAQAGDRRSNEYPRRYKERAREREEERSGKRDQGEPRKEGSEIRRRKGKTWHLAVSAMRTANEGNIRERKPKVQNGGKEEGK